MVCIEKYEILKYTKKFLKERGVIQYLNKRYRFDNKSFMK